MHTATRIFHALDGGGGAVKEGKLLFDVSISSLIELFELFRGFVL
jgi:hypothetical protein